MQPETLAFLVYQAIDTGKVPADLYKVITLLGQQDQYVRIETAQGVFLLEVKRLS